MSHFPPCGSLGSFVRFVSYIVSLQLLSCGSVFFPIISADVRLPPIIVQRLNDTVIAVNGRIILDCAAVGTPSPKYKWLKNGHSLDHHKNIRIHPEGLLEITEFSNGHEGYYQCMAENQHGTAISHTSLVRQAKLHDFESRQREPNLVQLREGEPHTLRWIDTEYYPKLQFAWALAQYEHDDSPVPLRTNNRVQIDEEGSLHFAYVTKADEDHQYKCTMHNPYLKLSKNSRGFRDFTVIPVSGPIPVAEPRLMFSSPSQVVALEGRDISIRCFFSGYPAPKVEWSKFDEPLTNRHKPGNWQTQLTIQNVQKYDAGIYICRTDDKKANHSIEIIVQASPVFERAEDQLQNMNVTDGDNVTFTCNPSAEPRPQITWMRNGVTLSPESLPERYSLSDEGRTLQISNLCKSCRGGGSDLAVIQCNASNTHGYVLGQGYVNVLERTQLTERPENVSGTATETLHAVFLCDAVTDESTALNVTWYKVHRTGARGGERLEPLYNHTQKIFIGNGGRTLNITLLGNTSDWTTYTGVYKCIASNGYSTDSATATLSCDSEIILEELPVRHPMEKWWWIFVVIAGLLFIVILVICICLCTRNSKGNTYRVDVEERKNGNNPVSDMEAEYFRDYQRQDNDKGLDDFEDAYTQNFSEDGSFIGPYAAICHALPRINEDGSSIGPHNSNYNTLQRINEGSSFTSPYASRCHTLQRV